MIIQFFPKKSLVTIGVLTVMVKVLFRFKAGVSGKFDGGPYKKVSFYQRAVLQFLRYVHFGQTWDFRGILRSGRSLFCVTGAGHGRFLICVEFVSLSARCWNVGRRRSKSEMVSEAIFPGRHNIWWTWTMFWKARKSSFVKLLSLGIWYMMMISRGKRSASDALGPFFVASAIL